MRIPWIVVVGAFGVFLAACSDSGSSGSGDVISSTDAPAAASTVTAAPATTTSAEPATEGDGTAQTPDALVVAEGWSRTELGVGTKPVLALNPEGVPGVAFLFEDIPEGFVAYASAEDSWTVDLLVEGYFYGPIGLDYDPSGEAHVAYHDHQASTFRQELGDLTVGSRSGTEWNIVAAVSDGHDGWDSTIRVGQDGIVRAAGVDPSQFGRVEGLEYYELVDGTWQVEAIGTGPLEYEWNVDLQVGPSGEPGLTYFRSDSADLIYASRSGQQWTTEIVDEAGDVGRFSSFVYDDGGNVHISYWNGDTGAVLYATNESGGWVSEQIDVLTSVEVGFEGARRITSLFIGADGAVRVAYSDVAGVWLAERDVASGTWLSEQIVTAGQLPLGQLVSLEVDSRGASHIAFFEVTANSPLAGIVSYVTNS